MINRALNMRGKYILVGKIINRGGIHYKTYGLDGVTRVVSSSVFKKQVEGYKILNCIMINKEMRGLLVQLDVIPVHNNISKKDYILYSEEHIIEVIMDNYNKNRLNIVARIVNGKVCIGYVLQNSNGNRAAYRRATAIELIQKGYIVNATYQRYKGVDVIKGIDFRLCELPVVLYNRIKGGLIA